MTKKYEDAGVSIQAGDETVKKIKNYAKSTFNKSVLTDIGLFGAFFQPELKKYKAGLSDAQLDKMVAETKALVDYQKQEDSPEALATIPMLELSDIDTSIQWYPVSKKTVSEIPVLQYNDFK